MAAIDPGRVVADLRELKGLTGKGTTIVIVDSFGSPTIANDVHQFDSDFGLPDPPSLKVIQPAGPVPPFDVTNDDMTGWAFETTLDVEYAHAIAPGANILLVETPVSETEGVQGFPEIVMADPAREHMPERHHHRVLHGDDGLVRAAPGFQAVVERAVRGKGENVVAHPIEADYDCLTRHLMPRCASPSQSLSSDRASTTRAPGAPRSGEK